MVQISAAVGPGRPNKSGDVKTVQALLNRNILFLTPLRPLEIKGEFDRNTELAIRTFQERVVKMQRTDGIVGPNGPTLKALNAQAGTLPQNTTQTKAEAGLASLSEEQLVEAARALKCETAAVKAVVKTELGVRTAFDEQGRPTILYERHYFHRLTGGKYSKDHPDISNAVAGGYGKFSEQYPKLEKAMKLDKAAALKSASWGAFQIMGDNHVSAGFATVDEFVAAMKTSVKRQADAFVAFVKNDSVLTTALRDKSWAAFAKRYNGPGYAANAYDAKMKANYDSFVKP